MSNGVLQITILCGHMKLTSRAWTQTHSLMLFGVTRQIADSFLSFASTVMWPALLKWTWIYQKSTIFSGARKLCMTQTCSYTSTAEKSFKNKIKEWRGENYAKTKIIFYVFLSNLGAVTLLQISSENGESLRYRVLMGFSNTKRFEIKYHKKTIRKSMNYSDDTATILRLAHAVIAQNRCTGDGPSLELVRKSPSRKPSNVCAPYKKSNARQPHLGSVH